VLTCARACFCFCLGSLPASSVALQGPVTRTDEMCWSKVNTNWPYGVQNVLLQTLEFGYILATACIFYPQKDICIYIYIIRLFSIAVSQEDKFVYRIRCTSFQPPGIKFRSE
jgi:hypothetical protein